MSTQFHSRLSFFVRLCDMQSIWQFSSLVSPPFDHAVTWSVSISLKS
jgi:hypothetical protein